LPYMVINLVAEILGVSFLYGTAPCIYPILSYPRLILTSSSRSISHWKSMPQSKHPTLQGSKEGIDVATLFIVEVLVFSRSNLQPFSLFSLQLQARS
jgi:hypothetical protein